MLTANPKFLDTWGQGKTRCRHDYDSADHLLSEMMHEAYFNTVHDQLAEGDLIWITDAAKEQAIVRVDWKDAKLRSVGFSVQERIAERAIAGDDGMALKYRGPRGGFWCVVDANSEVLSKDHRTKQDAERARDVLKSKAAA